MNNAEIALRSSQYAKRLRWKKIFTEAAFLGITQNEVWDCKTLEALQVKVLEHYKEIVNYHHPDSTPKKCRVPYIVSKNDRRSFLYEYTTDVWMSLHEASEVFGVSKRTLQSRISKGFTLNEAVHKKKNTVYKGVRKSKSKLNRAIEARRFFLDLKELPSRSTQSEGFILSDSLPMSMERW